MKEGGGGNVCLSYIKFPRFFMIAISLTQANKTLRCICKDLMHAVHDKHLLQFIRIQNY